MGICTLGGFPDSSVGKESACEAGNPSLILGSGRSTGEGIGYPLQYSWTCGSAGKESTCNVGDLGSIWVGKIPWRRESYPLQYSGLKNSMDYTVHGVTKTQSLLSDFHFHLHFLIPFTHSSSPQSCSFFFFLYLGAYCLVFYILHLSEIVQCLSFSNLVYLA